MWPLSLLTWKMIISYSLVFLWMRLYLLAKIVHDYESLFGMYGLLWKKKKIPKSSYYRKLQFLKLLILGLLTDWKRDIHFPVSPYLLLQLPFSSFFLTLSTIYCSQLFFISKETKPKASPHLLLMSFFSLPLIFILCIAQQLMKNYSQRVQKTSCHMETCSSPSPAPSMAACHLSSSLGVEK